MTSQPERSICIIPALQGIGGPSSFVGKMKVGLAQRGFNVHHDPSDPTTAAILVVAGTRHLDWLWQAKRRGVRIVQRLDGMNWVHRLRYTGVRHFLRSEVNNWILATIRASLADTVVYQSHFSQSWWNTKKGSVRTPSEVVYNGVDLQAFAPQGKLILPSEHVRLLVVEGHLDRSHQLELKHALELRAQLEQRIARPVELVVTGDVSTEMRTWADHNYKGSINWKGVIDRAAIPGLDRSSHLLFPVEINAACPNSVIEAIACGLPVVSFATGSLSELVDDEAGCIVPYGGNYWKLEMGNIPALVDAALQVLDQREKYSAGARSRAVRMFGTDTMVEGYIEALLGE